MQRNRTIYASLMLICSCMLTIGQIFIFPVCTSDHQMMCEISAKVVNVLGVAIALNSMMILTSKIKPFQSALAIANTIISVITILIPAWIIGGCKNHSMRCQTVSFPIVYLISVVVIICSILFILKNRNIRTCST